MFIGGHDIRITSADRIALGTIKLIAINVGLFFAAVYIIKIQRFAMKFILLYYCIMWVLLTIWWLAARYNLKKQRAKGKNYRRVIIIGGGVLGRNLVEEMRSDNGYGYNIEGVFGHPDVTRDIDDVTYLGGYAKVEDYIKNNPIDELYCTVADNALTEQMIIMAEKHAVDFYYVPQVPTRLQRQFSLDTFGNVPALALRPNPLGSIVNRFIKRTFDIIVSSVFLILFPIVLIPVAIAIKLSSPGPIFFRQKRTGYRGKEFWCYKFRTMKVNNQSDTQQATKDDPRKTKVGNFLRRSSIDELPQFINVWLGDMSLVGPRPHMIKHTEEYGKLIDKYMLRHTIKPGITGWAQVHGFRGETKELWQMEKRVEFDIWYTENWNFMLDIKIILKTIINAVRGEKNAF